MERLEQGRAFMICNECGAKLYEFDGYQDMDKKCPYKKGEKGECTDELLYKNMY